MRNRITALKKEAGESGFTLIELLIVIVILGILAGIVVFAVGTATGDSKASACKADKKTVQVAVEAYKAKKGTYPTSTAAFTSGTDQTLKAFPTATVSDDGYAISYDGSTGAVTATGACT